MINNIYNFFLYLSILSYCVFTMVLFTLLLFNTIFTYYYNKYIFVYIIVSLLLLIYGNIFVIFGCKEYSINLINKYSKKIITSFVLYLTCTMIFMKYCEEINVNKDDYSNNNEYILNKNRIKSICISVYLTFVLDMLFLSFVFYALKKGPVEQIQIPHIESIPNISIIIDKKECVTRCSTDRNDD